MAASVRRNKCQTLGEFKLILPDPADNWAIVMIEGPVTILQATDKVFTLANGQDGTVLHLAPGETVKVIKGSLPKPGLLQLLGMKKPVAPESFTITFYGDRVTIG